MADEVMIATVAEAFANQVSYCRANGAPVTAAVVSAVASALQQPGEFLRMIREWPGHPVADALPLRAAAGIRALALGGGEAGLDRLYAGKAGALADVAPLVADVIARNDAALLPWLDGPPQTNELGRSSNYVAALLWLAARGVPPTWECLEIGSSAGINLLMDRFRYCLGGVGVGPKDGGIVMQPEWRGDAPPSPPQTGWRFARMAGCDVAPVDLRDPAEVLRLRAYIWPEQVERSTRFAMAAASLVKAPPELHRADAADFLDRQLLKPQADGVTRVVMHSIVWQYLGAAGQARIEAAIAQAGERATPERPLAWIALEANRTAYAHELVVRHWPGDGAPHLLARAHAHGAWIEWLP